MADTTKTLPPLPFTDYSLFYEAPGDDTSEGWQEVVDAPGYTAEQMRAYAAAAIAAQAQADRCTSCNGTGDLVDPTGEWRGYCVCPDGVALKAQPTEASGPAWRELCRRLYVELFHCDQQLCSLTDEDGDEIVTQGSTVRDVLADARSALESPATAPTPTEPRRVYLVCTGEMHEGEVTYTRHDDAPPPLCDAECLYTAPPAAQAHGEPEKLVPSELPQYLGQWIAEDGRRFTLAAQAQAEPVAREVCGISYVEVRSEAVDWLKKHYPALCEKSGLCKRIGGRLYTRSVTPAPQPAAQPVADELRIARGAIRELEAKVFSQEQALAVLRASVDSYHRDMADPPGYLQDAVIRAAGLGAMAEQIAALKKAQPVRQPLTEHAILDLMPTTIPAGMDGELLWFARALERAHSIGQEGGAA